MLSVNDEIKCYDQEVQDIIKKAKVILLYKLNDNNGIALLLYGKNLQLEKSFKKPKK